MAVEPLRIADAPFRPRDVLEALHRHRVDYVLIGGLAATVHGSPLLTRDVDLTPRRSPENLASLCAALVELGAQLRVPDQDLGVPISVSPDWLNRMMSTTFITRAGMVDIVMLPDGIPDIDALFESATERHISGTPVKVAALHLIIRSKQAANRPKDAAALPVLLALRDHPPTS